MNYILSGNESIAKIAYKKALDHDVKEMVKKGHHHYGKAW